MDAIQNNELFAAYGSVIFYGHLIEDILKLHLRECAMCKINGFDFSPAAIEQAKFKTLIDFLPRVYCPDTHSETEKTVRALHLIRKIRNELAHGFIMQIYTELRSDEGKDQIIAMLQVVGYFENQYLRGLQEQHKRLFQHILKTDFMKIFETPDHPLPEGRVSTSKVQSLIDDLRELHKTEVDPNLRPEELINKR